MQDITEKVGHTIRRLRKEHKMSQETLADKSNLHPTYIGQLERGEKNASIETLEKITEAFHISLADFFLNMDEFILANTREEDEYEELKRRLEKIDKNVLIAAIMNMLKEAEE